MVGRQSRRAFFKHAARLAAYSGLATTLGLDAAAQQPDSALETFARSLSANNWGQILRPGDAEHAKVKYYNGRFDCVKTKAVFRPSSAEGVLRIVEWARQNRRKFSVRGAGHSFEGKSCHPDLVIDMSGMKKLVFKPEGTLEVEAGVVLGDVYNTLSPAGHILPAGTCPSVGIVGHTLGGGIGDYLPMFGFAAQSLQEVTLVTFGGTMLRVSDQAITLLGGAPLPPNMPRPADLMKVLRGGGQGTFGIVTNMTLRTHDVRNFKLGSFHFDSVGATLSAAKAVGVIRAWQSWRQALPQPLHALTSAKLNLSRDNARYGIEIMGLFAIPPGSPIDIATVKRSLDSLDRLPELSQKGFVPSLDVAGTIKTFLDDQETSFNPERSKLYGSSSALPRALSKAAVEHMIRNLPSTVWVSMYTSGGASRSGPATSLHPSEFLVEWSTYRPRYDPAAPGRIKKLRTDVVRIAGLEDLAFPNYPDNENRDYFTNRPQLAAVRAAFDPDALSTSSLVSGALPRSVDSVCT